MPTHTSISRTCSFTFRHETENEKAETCFHVAHARHLAFKGF